MMKEEFEKMICKEISCDTFYMYEAMYNALPENVNKQQFVKMLNIDATPESEDAIKRRENNKALIEEIKQKVKEEREKIDNLKRDTAYYKSLIEEETDIEMINIYKRHISYNRAEARFCKNRIAEYRWIIG